MKPFDHSEFEHERRAFAELEKLLPASDSYELYPSIYITDEGRRTKLECDALFISETFAAVIELKDWFGRVEVTPNYWFRGGQATRNPHEINLPKAKVFKSHIEKALPASKSPFVQSIVVLTSDKSLVDGADDAFEIVRELEQNKRLGDHLTFVGMQELAKYLKERVKRDLAQGRAVLSSPNFRKLRKVWDENFEIGCRRDDYADQIPGFRILQDIEHNDRYVSYLAEANPKRGDTLYRLRVFGFAADTLDEQARQFRSLEVLEGVPAHPNIRSVNRLPNEKGLVVEYCQWVDVKTLDQILETNESVNLDFAVRVVRDVAGALAHIHNSTASLVHRNVTPRSIIVGREDHVELTDFDFAFDPAADYTVMADSFSDYEKRYYPPEALAGQTDYGFDVFSLGETFTELLKKSSGDETLIDELYELTKRMKAADRSDRPHSQDVFTELTALLGENPTEAQDPLLEEKPSRPDIGDSHDTWSLVKRLGSGGTSDVFLGDSLGELAALKIFNGEVPRDRVLAERDFLRAAKSRFLVGYRGFLQWSNAYWCIAEEYVEGVTLKSLISGNDRPDPKSFISVAEKILQGLADLHESYLVQGDGEDEALVAITHNDVTPGNIVFNPEKQTAKLIDFGLASVSGDKVMGGTPGYASQALMTKEGYLASPSGDLYSLAVTLIEWATGRRPAASNDVPLLFESYLTLHQSERLQKSLQSMLEIKDPQTVYASLVRREFMSLLVDEEEGAHNVDVADDATGEEQKPLTEEEVDASEVEYRQEDAQAADGFVRYLNSIHNISADNRYALAEAQATSTYFTDLHVELELVSSIRELVSADSDVVVILTGHAGDGKSTVALDIWKHALGVPDNEPATRPPKEEETVTLAGNKLTIVKDMSELSAQSRAEKLTNAFSQPGSALIVSNTGPLLSAFTELLAKEGHGRRETQQKFLECLNQPLLNDQLSDINVVQLDGKKRVYLANLSMLSNVNTAERLLSKLAAHSGWSKCSGCNAKERCPIRRNVETINQNEETVGERVGDIYRRLDAYGRRMTMRQIAAHLSFSLTGGLSCRQVRQDPKTASQCVFSETFFGHGTTVRHQAVDALSCLRQMADLHFGIAASPKFDQQLHEGKLENAWNYPAPLSELKAYFLSRLGGSNDGIARREIRRLTYMFSTPREGYQASAEVFFNDFLQSPMLRQLRTWSAKQNLSGVEKQRFVRQVLGVLMEEYIGVSVPRNKRDSLFITLRRPDEKVFQSVQIVLGKIPVDEFTIDLDAVTGLPLLKHSVTKAKLELTLPLLDYIISKDQGELTSDLDAIHGASLEQFRSDLLERVPTSPDNINLLEIDAEGELRTHKFMPIDGGQKLVYQ